MQMQTHSLTLPGFSQYLTDIIDPEYPITSGNDISGRWAIDTEGKITYQKKPSSSTKSLAEILEIMSTQLANFHNTNLNCEVSVVDKEKLIKLKAMVLDKAEKFSGFFSFNGAEEISKVNQEMKKIVRAIEHLGCYALLKPHLNQPLPLPDILQELIGSQLDLASAINLEKATKYPQPALVEAACLETAHIYGYNSDNRTEAKAFLKTLFNDIQSVGQKLWRHHEAALAMANAYGGKFSSIFGGLSIQEEYKDWPLINMRFFHNIFVSTVSGDEVKIDTKATLNKLKSLDKKDVSEFFQILAASNFSEKEGSAVAKYLGINRVHNPYLNKNKTNELKENLHSALNDGNNRYAKFLISLYPVLCQTTIYTKHDSLSILEYAKYNKMTDLEGFLLNYGATFQGFQ